MNEQAEALGSTSETCTCRHPYPCDLPPGVEVELPELPSSRWLVVRHNRKVRLQRASEEAAHLRKARRAEIRAQLIEDDPARWIALLEQNLALAQDARERAERDRGRFIMEADQYRLLWHCAAGVLRRARLPAQRKADVDVRRMLAASQEIASPVSSGGTDGWLDWLPDPEDDDAQGQLFRMR